MDRRFRKLYNAGYSETLYRRYLADFSRRCGVEIDMQIAQTPVFLPTRLRERAETAGRRILEQLCDPARIERMQSAVPPRWNAPGNTGLPTFCAIDFAITLDAYGELVPKLIELQGFPTLIAYQTMQHDAWAETLQGIEGLDLEWTSWFSGLTRADFVRLARRTILANREPGTSFSWISIHRLKNLSGFHCLAPALRHRRRVPDRPHQAGTATVPQTRRRHRGAGGAHLQSRHCRRTRT